jgi:hypothetical protein
MSQVRVYGLKFGGTILSKRKLARLNKFSKLNTSFWKCLASPQDLAPCARYSALCKGRFKASAVFPRRLVGL